MLTQTSKLILENCTRCILLCFIKINEQQYFSKLINKYSRNLDELPTLGLGPHCAYFRMRKLKPQVAKVSTVASVMRDK